MPPADQLGTILRLNVTYVEVPVTVKDSKGKLVAGLTWRDFRVFENGNYEPLKEFFVDPFPMSMVFVVDRSLRRRRHGHGESVTWGDPGSADALRRNRS